MFHVKDVLCESRKSQISVNFNLSLEQLRTVIGVLKQPRTHNRTLGLVCKTNAKGPSKIECIGSTLTCTVYILSYIRVSALVGHSSHYQRVKLARTHQGKKMLSAELLLGHLQKTKYSFKISTMH